MLLAVGLTCVHGGWVLGCGCRGRVGREREPMSSQSSCALGRQIWEDCQTLSTRPRMGIWLCEATGPHSRGRGGTGDGQGTALIPEAPGQHSQPWREGRGREVPMQARVFSLVHGWRTARTSDRRLGRAH